MSGLRKHLENIVKAFEIVDNVEQHIDESYNRTFG